MFDSLTQKKQSSFKFKLLAIGSGAIHVVLGGALLVMGMWQIEEIGRPNRGVVMAATIERSSSGGSPKAAEPKALLKPKKEIVRERRQPSAQVTDKVDPTTETKGGSGDGKGEGDGVGQGKGDGKGDGTGLSTGPSGLGIDICIEDCDDPGVPKPVVEKGPTHLPPTVLSRLTRVSGASQVQPTTPTKNSMRSKRSSKIVALVQMCLDKSGAVNRQHIVKSSGYPEYDARLLTAVRRWRYKPYRANGKAIAICTHVTFVYQQ